MSILSNITHNSNINKPVIYGCSSYSLSDEEKYFFSKSGAVGFILFSRNVKNKTQVKALTDSLKELMGGEVLILIDQEGGRVSRLKGDDWQKYPTGQYFADLYQKNQKEALDQCYKNYSAIAKDLVDIGINTNCAPLLDILTATTHSIIGDRAFGSEPQQVVNLAKKASEGLLDNNIYPVIKHIPGHGRAICDSHLDLPIVSSNLASMRNSDFIPFKELSYIKFAMTAHILYKAFNTNLPATICSNSIDLIRNEIGFKNILMTDDISMKALKGSVGDLSIKALQSGCDLILHCNGKMNEMQEIDSILPQFSDNLKEKFIN